MKQHLGKIPSQSFESNQRRQMKSQCSRESPGKGPYLGCSIKLWSEDASGELARKRWCMLVPSVPLAGDKDSGPTPLCHKCCMPLTPLSLSFSVCRIGMIALALSEICQLEMAVSSIPLREREQDVNPRKNTHREVRHAGGDGVDFTAYLRQRLQL